MGPVVREMIPSGCRTGPSTSHSSVPLPFSSNSVSVEMGSRSPNRPVSRAWTTCFSRSTDPDTQSDASVAVISSASTDRLFSGFHQPFKVKGISRDNQGRSGSGTCSVTIWARPLLCKFNSSVTCTATSASSCPTGPARSFRFPLQSSKGPSPLRVKLNGPGTPRIFPRISPAAPPTRASTFASPVPEP